MVKPASGVCCSCSKKSSCKTSKCECRVSGGSCGTSCGCAANKCTNRELGSVETEMTSSLTSEGAMLLQNSLIEKPLETKDDCCTRKQPLREIGNKLVCFLISSPTTPHPKKKMHIIHACIATIIPWLLKSWLKFCRSNQFL